ncbi:MAG: ABC transporter substrate-binding protein [Patescibacteria group bacterium]
MKNILIIIAVAVVLGGVVWMMLSQKAPATDRQETNDMQKTFKVGILYKGSNFKKVVDGFIDGLNSGVQIGQKVEYVIIDEKGTEQKDFDASAASLVSNGVDLILGVGLEPVLAAKKATVDNKIPVLLALGANPVNAGIVDSLQHPGGNITGLSWQAEELSGKRLEFLKKIDLRVKRVTIFRKKGSKLADTAMVYVNKSAQDLGITITIKDVVDLPDLEKAVLATTSRDTDAFYAIPDPFVARNTNFIIKQAIDQKIPMMLADDNLVKAGALASYGGSFYGSGEQLSILALKILFEDVSPANIPVEAISKIDFVINMTTAMKIDLTIPSDVLSLAQIVK